MEKKKRNKLAFYLAMASSLFLLISGTTGVSSWVKLEDIILNYFNFQLIRVIFVLLIIVASFGAIAVFVGAILILKKKVTLGRILVSLGSGAGIIGFLFNLLISLNALKFSISPYLSFSSLGVIFALLSQVVSKKKS